MSLEIAIQELTAAIENATLIMQHSLAAQIVATPQVEPVKEEPATKVTKKRVVPALKDIPEPEPVVEPEPEQAFEELLEEIDESFSEPSIQLPAGERNAAYYAQHVQPVLQQLGAKDKPALANLVRVVFNAQKGNLIPPDQWDKLVNEATYLLAA